MIRFSKAITVEPSERIGSRHHNALARAINERILSGLGDGAFRIVEYMLGLFRATLMGEGLRTHAEAEYFEVYQHVRPGTATWPLTGVDPGSGLPEPNGPNIQNPIMAWVYGNRGAGLDNEATRLARVPICQADDSADTKWATAKLQRGAVDPTTGFTVSPVRDLSMEFARLAYRKDGVYNVTYGGFLPGPDEFANSPCNPPCVDCDIFPRANLHIYFTATRPGVSTAGLHFAWTEEVPWSADPEQSVVRGHYAGTCLSTCILGTDPECVEGYPDHINVHYELPTGWQVYLNDGTLDRLPHNDWIEGPYSAQKQLSRDYGDQVRRAVNAFSREFRGADTQRPGGKLNPHLAFGNQAIFTEQYALAPARGIQVGSQIDVRYPCWTAGAGEWTQGTLLRHNFGGTQYAWHEGFVASHLFAKVRSSEADRRVVLLIAHADGEFQVEATTDGSITPISPAARLLDVTVSLVDDVTLEPGESVILEATELVAYKPTWYDLYAILRKGGAQLVGAEGGDFASATLDGSGPEETQAAEICSEYLETGAIVNVHDVHAISEPTSVNENAVYDAARRLSKVVRVLSRFTFMDYAVEGGDSILWFTPHPRTDAHPMVSPQDDGDPDVDIFEDVDVRAALPGAFSQRWVMDAWLKPYTSAEGSPMSFDLYADWFADVNRCLVNDRIMYESPTLARHLNRNSTLYGAAGSQWPQAPSGWNYAQLFNSTAGAPKFLNYKPEAYTEAQRIAFAKSCRIYEPPVELRKVERVRQSGRDLVKITLKGRIHNTSGETGGAPATIPRHGWIDRPDADGAWDWSTIAAEPYRSLENALRLYLFFRWKGTPAPVDLIMGDFSLGQSGLNEGQHAAVIPHFYLVQLVPEAVVDQNDLQNRHDSPFNHDAELQAEWYLRCLCEGAVAGEAALECSDPASARTYDWKWANLCTHLFGLPSVSAFPLSQTDRLGAADVRDDGPEGFGPMPMTKASSEVFNRLVQIVNALTRYRVMLPWRIEQRDGTGSKTRWVPGQVDYGCGVVTDCGDKAWCVTDTAPLPCGEVTWGDWAETDGLGVRASTGAGLDGGCDDSGSWALTTVRSVSEFRFSIVDWSICQHAIPADWRDMMTEASQHAGAVFSWERQVRYNEASSGSSDCPADTTCHLEERLTTSARCIFLRNGSALVDAGAVAPGGWFATAWDRINNMRTNLCAMGSGITIDVSLLSDTVPILEVPVVDLPEGVEQSWVKR